ncbi:hypothetical protein IFM89_028428 [Coptis chinensis]|uniref:Uncharacterized protein n=1 Tax=Coptis chinensis TaxID=261450 RepID=A0A835IQ32_9MAGN|nr:hypothetical protein IFM89_028428 [Coptis chinensis]
MDLGFVFSEEDKNSSLVSIIPGLQRLGEKKHEEEEEEEEENEEEENESGVDEKKDVMVVSRPYLSEAWEFMDDRKEEKAPFMMMNWRFPSLSNEIDMKDHLRSWAHSVASAVR